MTRPASYDNSLPVNRCGTCQHCHYVRYVELHLCFHGDEIEAHRDGPDTFDRSDVDLLDLLPGDRSVQLMEDDEFERVWPRRSVDAGDTCDEWQLRDGLESDGSVKGGDA